MAKLKAPAKTRRPAGRKIIAPADGTYKHKLSRPFPASKLKDGMAVVMSSAVCIAQRVTRNPQVPHLVLFEVTGHPNRRDWMETRSLTDTLYQGIEQVSHE